MSIYDISVKARACRRFTGEYLSSDFLASLVDCARISPCSRNSQVLRYITVSSPELCEAMTPFVVLGGALKPEQKANAQQHPRGFIVIMGPEKKEDFFMMDTGIAAQTIHLAAAEAGIESCMVIVFNRKEIEKLLQIPEDLYPYMVLAMGSPDEERSLVEVPEDGKLAYYRDENDTHCVPKLPLDAVLISRR